MPTLVEISITMFTIGLIIMMLAPRRYKLSGFVIFILGFLLLVLSIFF